MGAEPVDAVQPALDLRAERVVERLADVLEDHGRRGVGAASRDTAR